LFDFERDCSRKSCQFERIFAKKLKKLAPRCLLGPKMHVLRILPKKIFLSRAFNFLHGQKIIFWPCRKLKALDKKNFLWQKFFSKLFKVFLRRIFSPA